MIRMVARAVLESSYNNNNNNKTFNYKTRNYFDTLYARIWT